jgi:hypothetical protein
MVACDMDEISEETVTRTWQEASALSSAQARREMTRAGREQPELLAFVLGSVYDCRAPAQELAVYLYFVIHLIFQNAAKAPLRPIQAAAIEKRVEENEARLARLEAAHPRFQERAAVLEMSPQPFVVRYLVEAIMESSEIEDPVELSEEEMGILFLVLKTVIDLLHGEGETEG